MCIRDSRGGVAATPAKCGHGSRCHLGRAGDSVPLGRYQARARRRGRAVRGVRAGRYRRGQRGDPFLLAPRPRPRRQRCAGRSLCAAAPRGAAAGERPHRQFRRGERGYGRDRCQGQPSHLYRRRERRSRGECRRRHHHLQLRWRLQASYRDRQERLHRLELVAGGAGEDRRGRLCRLGLGDHPGCACGRAGGRPRAAGSPGGVGGALAGALGRRQEEI